MKTFNNITSKSRLRPASVVLAVSVFVSSSAFSASIFTEDFGGDTTALNGTSTTTGGGTWIANSIATTDGGLTGDRGSALLAYDFQVNTIYTLSIDVTSTGDTDWVALGFTQNGLNSAGLSDNNDRIMKDPNGAAWMLYRYDATVSEEVQVFKGLGNLNQIADTGAWVTGTQTLTIVLDTTGDGTDFTADFKIGGTSITSGAQAMGLNVDVLNYAGFSISDASNASVGNFSLDAVAVPEPSSAALLGIGGLALILRRRK